MEVSFLLLRAFGRENALARLQSDPLFEGLAKLGHKAAKLVYSLDAPPTQFPRASHICVHYNDVHSVLLAKELKKLTGCKVICLGSDLYDLDGYVTLSEIADIFLMPTQLHKEILSAAVWTRVEVLSEGIDSISLPYDGKKLPVAENNSLCWFGYPESFEKSFKYILGPALEKSHFPKERMALITAQGAQLMDGVAHLNFNEESFYAQSAHFGYSLLSHFAFDYHINTYIKSPNKLLTSLVRGMVPLVSNTPNYRQFIEEYGLQNFAYATGAELAELLQNLDIARDRNKLGSDAIAQNLKARFSPEKIATIFLNSVS